MAPSFISSFSTLFPQKPQCGEAAATAAAPAAVELLRRIPVLEWATEEARACVHAALQALDDGRPDAREAIWHAKVQTARSACFVGAQGVQLHGGMGMTDDLAVGHYYKRLSQLEAMFGDADYYLNALSAA